MLDIISDISLLLLIMYIGAVGLVAFKKYIGHKDLQDRIWSSEIWIKGILLQVTFTAKATCKISKNSKF